MGYVRIWPQEGGSERLMNLYGKGGIWLRGVERDAHGVCLLVPAVQFKRALRLAERAGCRVNTQACGLLPTLKRYRGRWCFGVFLLLSALLVWQAGRVVWSIELTGGSQTDEKKMLDYFQQNGLYVGAVLNRVDTEYLERKTQYECKDIIYCSIGREGTRVVIDLRDRRKAAPVVPLNLPCNLVATRAGQISHMEVRCGDAMVQPGQGVKKGQLLVNGVQDSKLIGYRLLHSFGEVWAVTEYDRQYTIPLVRQTQVPTGREKRQYMLELFGIRINLSKYSSISYTKYDKIKVLNHWNWMGKELPVLITTTVVKETQTQAAAMDEQTACRLAVQHAEEAFLQENANRTVLQKDVEYRITEKTVTALLHFTCEENIAAEDPIPQE